MGFLSNLLTPHKHLKVYKGSTKALLSGNVKAGLDAGGLLAGKYDNEDFMQGTNKPSVGIPDLSSSPKSNPANNYDGAVDPSLYAGDETDPAYGSFTDPFTVEDFYEYADPGYAFRLQQGTQALQNSAAAGSGALSGAALKDLLAFNQDYASQEYGNAFNRYQTQQGSIFGRLFDLARLGQNAASGVGTSGTQLAGNSGEFLSNAGAAYGAGIVGAGNALGQGATDYWLMKRYAPPPSVGAGTV